jgi:hypothetical protein
MLKLTYSRKVILAFFIFIITLFTLTGCAKKDNKQDIEKEKVKDEIYFLDETIITMMNRANNISFNNYKVISENVKQEKTGSTHRTK